MQAGPNLSHQKLLHKPFSLQMLVIGLQANLHVPVLLQHSSLQQNLTILRLIIVMGGYHQHAGTHAPCGRLHTTWACHAATRPRKSWGQWICQAVCHTLDLIRPISREQGAHDAMRVKHHRK